MAERRQRSTAIRSGARPNLSVSRRRHGNDLPEEDKSGSTEKPPSEVEPFSRRRSGVIRRSPKGSGQPSGQGNDQQSEVDKEDSSRKHTKRYIKYIVIDEYMHTHVCMYTHCYMDFI